MKKIITLINQLFFSKILNYLLRFFNYIIIFRSGEAIGDHVYMSSVIREINIKNKKKILLFTNYYELYFNNPRISKLFKFDLNSHIWFFLRSLKSKNILEFNSVFIEKEMDHNFLFYHKNKEIPLAQAMSEHFELNINYSNIKNEFFFSKDEIEIFEKKYSYLGKFSLIQSITKKTYTKNKDWKVEGMQNIINNFKNINWIQIGTSLEPKLTNCNHLFDLKLREVIFLIYKCNFLVSYEGLFNHLASCFNKKNFLIHTGFVHSNSINYKNNILIHENDKMECYPCFKLDCINHNKNFISKLADEKVINTIRKNI